MSIAVPLYGFGASGGSPNKSTIIVTAPTGSTVACTMGSTMKTAPEKNGVWTFGGLDLGTWTITSTKGGDSATQDVVISRLTVEYVTIVYRITPEFTYTGDYEIVDDSDNAISDFANWKSNWKIRFLTSGTFTVTKLNGWNGQLDVFLVGGAGTPTAGASGVWYVSYGGDTATLHNVSVLAGESYNIAIGAHGSANEQGGATTAFGTTCSGGSAGGRDAHNNIPNRVKEFAGDTDSDALYGGYYPAVNVNAPDNSGSGVVSDNSQSWPFGGSGIVIARNARRAA